MTATESNIEGDVTPIKVFRSSPQSSKPSQKQAAKASEASKAPQAKFSNQKIVRHFELAVEKSASVNELFHNLSLIVSGQTKCLALWASQSDEEGNFSRVQSLTDENADAVWNVVGSLGNEMIAHVQSTKQICSAAVEKQPSTSLVVAPLNQKLGDERPLSMLLIGCFEIAAQSQLRVQWLMGMASQAVTSWYQRHSMAQSQTQQRSLNDALALVMAMDETKSHSELARVIVNQLRRFCFAEQVSITFDGELAAISDVEQINANSETSKVIEMACRQAGDIGEPVVYTGEDTESSPGQLALKNYQRSSTVEACLNFPLKDQEGKAIGAVLMGVNKQRLAEPGYVEHAAQLVKMTGGHVETVVRANRGVKEIVRDKVKSIANHGWKKYILLATAAIVGIMAIPLPYRVGCDCEIQPVLRRFVPAPYEGILEKTLVKHGDLVTKGQLLAQMDGRSLRIELSGLEAELAGARKRRDSALATGDIAKSQIARSEMARFQANIDLVEQRTKNLDVRSPIDGIIVKGDLEKVEGAPLEMGQTLFEVAPLEKMVAEVAIPESEINYSRPGMPVTIKLSAFPFEKWKGEVESIHPRAELLEDESVFIAQVSLVNESEQLRPGMKGAAKITTTWSPIGWNLFHKPWEAVRYWTIW